MSTYRRKLIFRTSGLAKGGYLLFTFKPLKDLDSKEKPVAWKVISFPKDVRMTAEIEYINKSPAADSVTGIRKPVPTNVQIGEENSINKAKHASVDTGGTVESAMDSDQNVLVGLTGTNKDENAGFTAATSGTEKRQDMTLGLLPIPRNNPIPQTDNPAVVVAKYHPILCAYMITDYRETELISGERRTDIIWERDLSQLEEATSWYLRYDSGSETYSLTPDEDS
ncbi:SubName: Full=Uncharacterized protein {ECO:0000313/EMBL:CCA74888.1} [Serendipita indica DSM 11827]|uniref:Uncharacterized protein n=1 Tax=Serendipita indica (strain DSM 11827) TaxID=1109443 RepID=G4TU95_SERID|nr:SubName: Full=Uncharacterized protein {ECO:0000313/EMBL:CCA74888.1} [Serendipita indica DSM 11827]CCA74888.1 hypothetical protein PIIN_08858 [Serendipita indica DSM 11827]